MTIQERVAEWVKEFSDRDEATTLLSEFTDILEDYVVVCDDGRLIASGADLTPTASAAFLDWVEARVELVRIDRLTYAEDGLFLRYEFSMQLAGTLRIMDPVFPDGDPESVIRTTKFSGFESTAPDLKQLNEIEEAKP